MNKIFNAASIAFGIICGAAAKIFGAWDGALWALVVIMSLDYVTGIIKAVYTKTVSSEIGYKGILKKIMILVVVALANTVTNLTGGNAAVREIVIMFYIANEGISVLENAAAVSPNMPQKLKDILLQIRGKAD
ncbi:MAG: phage holin family protein [Clostridia bacterium]|nr:phage holin family protein [Clostridia bacterium]